tara:strand:+ start:1113 stop:1715 length:603 start_codon:yes stop_codon:yes gene_type:complete
MRIVDTLIVFRILKMLTTPFTKQKAYAFGFIDKNGNRIKYKKNADGVKVPNKPFTKMEKSSLTLLHRLVFNLKRIIEKVPFGKSAFASYAVALLLLKEHTGLNDEQAEELYEKFYRYLKDNDKLDPEQIVETVNFDTLQEGTYNLRRQLKHGYDEDYNVIVYPEKTEVEVKEEYTKIYGVTIYEGYINDNKVYVCADDVY